MQQKVLYSCGEVEHVSREFTNSFGVYIFLDLCLRFSVMSLINTFLWGE